MATTVFPKIDVTQFALIGGGVLAVGAARLRRVDAARRSRRARGDRDRRGPERVPKSQWTMPQLTFLEPAVWSTRAQGGDARRCAATWWCRSCCWSSRPRSSAARDRRLRPLRAPTRYARRRPSSRSAAASTGAGAPVSGSAPLAVFGKAITSRIESRAGDHRDDAVDAERDAAVRRGAVAQRVEQEAEALLRLARASRPIASNTCSLDLGRVRADRAAAELGAVDDEVVGAREQRARVGEVELARRRRPGAGAVNGWCIAVQRRSASSYSNIGNSTTHSTSWRERSISPKRSAELEPQRAERLRRRPRARSATNSSRSPSLGAQLGVDRRRSARR